MKKAYIIGSCVVGMILLIYYAISGLKGLVEYMDQLDVTKDSFEEPEAN